MFLRPLITILVMLAFPSLIAQSRSSVRHVPSGNGFEFTVDFVYSFINCFGEVYAAYGIDHGSARNVVLHYNGKRYTMEELGYNFRFSSDINKVDGTADVYDNSARLMGISMSTILNSSMGGCYGEGQSVFTKQGRADLNQQYLQQLGRLRLNQIKLTASSHIYGALAKVKEKEDAEKDAAAQELVSKGQRAENTGNLDEALNYYQEALNVRSGYGPAQEGKARIMRMKREQEENERKKKEEEEQAAKRKEEEEKQREEQAKQAKQTENNEGTSEQESSSGGETQQRSNNDTYSQRESAEEIARRQEFERQQRKYEYDQKVAAQRHENYQAASEAAEGIIMAMYYLGGIIYKGVGDDYNHNVFKGDAPFLGIEFGFASSIQPLHTNSSTEQYDGISYSYDNRVVDHENWTIDLHAAMEAWPIYGKNYGLGFFAGGKAGIHLLFEGNLIEGNYGFRGVAGWDWIKLFGEYSRGFRSINHNPWLDPVEYGSGTSEFDYQRFRFGPRFSFMGNFFGHTNLHLDLHSVFELPDLNQLIPSIIPNPRLWATGAHLSFWGHNRLRIFLEVLFNQYRLGEQLYSPGADFSRSGTMVTLGVMRRMDFFSASAFQKGIGIVNSFQEAPLKIGLSLINPGFCWSDAPANEYFNRNLNVTFIPIWGEVDYHLLPFVSVNGGLGMTINTGAQVFTQQNTVIGSTTIPAGTAVDFDHISLEIPIGLRLWLPTMGISRYWAGLQFVNRFVMDSNLSSTSGGLSSAEVENYSPNYRIGLGTDVALAPMVGLRLGLHYQNEISPLLNGLTQQGITIQTGLVFSID